MHEHRDAMRRPLLILIALSLSWVTTGYACRMGSAIAQPVCCCDAVAPRSCLEPASDCTLAAMTGASRDGCCSVIATSSIVAQEQVHTPVTLPPLNTPAADLTKALPRGIDSVLSDALARDHHTPPIYLLTGRLRR